MKVLGVLKDARSVYVDCNRPRDIQKIDELIAEIKALMEPRMCDGCVYNVVDTPDDTCEDCARTYKDKYKPWRKTQNEDVEVAL